MPAWFFRRARRSGPQLTTRERHRCDAYAWRQHSRLDDRRALAEAAAGFAWSRSLRHALLEELPVSDEFDARWTLCVPARARQSRTGRRARVGAQIFRRGYFGPRGRQLEGERQCIEPRSSSTTDPIHRHVEAVARPSSRGRCTRQPDERESRRGIFEDVVRLATSVDAPAVSQGG
jgi:hypothetical protein